jgi:hypothetical protein
MIDDHSSKPRRGRPSLRAKLTPWLEKMREHVDAGETLRGAARIIATRHGPELPQGSAHHLSFESTVDLLRREYAAWEIEEE